MRCVLRRLPRYGLGQLVPLTLQDPALLLKHPHLCGGRPKLQTRRILFGKQIVTLVLQASYRRYALQKPKQQSQDDLSLLAVTLALP